MLLSKMNVFYKELADALQQRLDVIGDEKSRQSPEAHMRRLQDVSERIEAIEQRLPNDANPQLRHFLQRRSYVKALELLTANTALRSTAR